MYKLINPQNRIVNEFTDINQAIAECNKSGNGYTVKTWNNLIKRFEMVYSK